jgi:methylmalonyl-CoA mutase N-terminal domain/subunit
MKKRDNRKVTEAFKNVKKVAKSNKNIMPALIEAVKTYATIGEISDVLREVFGEYKDNLLID